MVISHLKHCRCKNGLLVSVEWMDCVILVTGFRCIVAGLAEPELNMSTFFREALVSVGHTKHRLF